MKITPYVTACQYSVCNCIDTVQMELATGAIKWRGYDPGNELHVLNGHK